jgi:hypothetical protein
MLLPQHAAVALSVTAIGYATWRRDGSMTIPAGWAAWNVAMVAGYMTAVGASHRLAEGLKTAVRVPAVAAVVCIALLGTSPAPLEPAARAAARILTKATTGAGVEAGPVTLGEPLDGAYLGVFNPSLLSSPSAVAEWSARHDVQPQIVHWDQQWGSGERRFREDWLAMVARQGAVSLITWEPWSKPEDRVHDALQPRYRLSAIASGAFDPFIRTWARAAAAYRGPLLLRPMHEMNGNWYPWSIKANGGTPRAFVQAWRRMHRLFREEGATNVRWVWAVNTFTGLGGEDRSVARYYPGDDFVDWVSVTGFNWGTSNAWSEWQDVDAVLGKTYRTLARFGKPVMVSELGTVGTGGNGSAWVGATMRRLRAEYPLVKAVVWFDARYPGGIDFRLGSREGAALAAVTSTPYWEPELRLVTPSPEARAPARGGT